MKIPVLVPIIAALCCSTLSPAQDSEKPRDKPHPEAMDKMAKVKQRIEELNAAGKHEEAETLAMRLRGEMTQPGEQPERMQHIMEAVRHLRAAGLKEPAENLEKMAGELKKAQAGGGGQSPKGEGADQMQRSMNELREQTSRAMRDMHEQTERALKETHEQMAKMARVIEELREQVGKREKRD